VRETLIDGVYLGKLTARASGKCNSSFLEGATVYLRSRDVK
jgi:hypothetical protein